MSEAVPGMPRLIFGAGGLHRLLTRKERQRVLRAAFDTGFRAFDTAPSYGNGLSELELGDAFRAERAQIRLITKYGLPTSLYGAQHPHLFPFLRGMRKILPGYGAEYAHRDFSPKALRASLEGSLRRLRTSHIDRLCVHEPLVQIDKSLLDDLRAEADRLKSEGKIASFAVSGEAACLAETATHAAFDAFQTRLSHYLEGRVRVSKPVAVFGVYQHYRNAAARYAEADGFTSFVRTLSDQHPGLEIILTSLSPSVVAKFAAVLK